MKYLLDTNICIHLFRGRFAVADRIQDVGWDNCYISEITKAELLLGEELALRKGKKVPPWRCREVRVFDGCGSNQ